MLHNNPVVLEQVTTYIPILKQAIVSNKIILLHLYTYVYVHTVYVCICVGGWMGKQGYKFDVPGLQLVVL